jgi:hypothetical protein
MLFPSILIERTREMKSVSMTVSTLALCILVPAAAQAGKLKVEGEGTLDRPITAIEIEVNDEIINDRPTVLDIRRSTRSDPWPVSQREANRLVKELREELEKDLSSTGAYSPDALEEGARLKVRIERVSPSQINLTDAGFRAGFRQGSYAIGGAKLTAELVDEAGEPLRSYEYRNFDDFFDARNEIGSYAEAERTMRRFSNRIAKDLDAPTSQE